MNVIEYTKIRYELLHKNGGIMRLINSEVKMKFKLNIYIEPTK
ncbi:hypothetical protein ABIB40_004216 [Pedobacter sp. UYP30]